jgi:hypothetical protein
VWRVLDDVTASVSVLANKNGVKVMVEPPTRNLRVGVEGDIALQIIQPVSRTRAGLPRAQ